MNIDILVDQYKVEAETLLESYLEKYQDYSDERSLTIAKEFLSNYHKDYRANLADLGSHIITVHEHSSGAISEKIIGQQRREESRLLNEVMKFNQSATAQIY